MSIVIALQVAALVCFLIAASDTAPTRLTAAGLALLTMSYLAGSLT